MSKFFKYTRVDEKTGVSVRLFPSNQPSHPKLPGIEVVYVDRNCDYHYCTADDSAVGDPSNYIFEMNLDSFLYEMETEISFYKNDYRINLINEFKQIQNDLQLKYFDVSGPFAYLKYQEAKEYLDNGAESSSISAESEISGESQDTIAQRYIDNYEEYKVKESKLIGAKNLLEKRINDFKLDPENVVESLKEWFNRKEIFGKAPQSPSPQAALPPFVDLDGNYFLKYYGGSLTQRWNNFI